MLFSRQDNTIIVMNLLLQGFSVQEQVNKIRRQHFNGQHQFSSVRKRREEYEHGKGHVTGEWEGTIGVHKLRIHCIHYEIFKE